MWLQLESICSEYIKYQKFEQMYIWLRVFLVISLNSALEMMWQTS